MAPLSSPKNFQVIKTYTLRESPKRFAKDRMRLYELSGLSKEDNQFVFFTQKISQKEERMS